MQEQIINVKIQKETWKQIGVISALEGKDRKDIVEEALKNYIVTYKKKKQDPLLRKRIKLYFLFEI